MSHRIYGYSYDADYHCPQCASKRFTPDELAHNEPVHGPWDSESFYVLYSWDMRGDEYCGDCLQPLTECA